MLSSILPAAGRLLISEPFMPDPNFKRSVVLLTEHSEAGTVGFVLNQPSEYFLGDVLPETIYSDIPLFIGGPVGENTLHFIHRCPEKIPGGIEICEGIFWGGDFELIKELVNSYRVKKNEVRFFVGYSGWSAGQLDDELRENAWIVSDQLQPELIFSDNDESMWKAMVKGLGQKYAHIANFPTDPSLN